MVYGISVTVRAISLFYRSVMLMVFGGMVLSVFGWMTPIWAAVLHAGSTLIIIFNSARLVRIGEELTLEEGGDEPEY